jgi:DNA polymerase II large subunit
MEPKITPVFRKISQAYREGHNLIILQGGQGCFAPDQSVVTSKGNIPIRDVKCGDSVKSFNVKTGKPEFKKVKNIFKYNNSKKVIRVILKNGNTITATEDHKFYFQGGWHSLKHILSLLENTNHGKMENNTRI